MKGLNLNRVGGRWPERIVFILYPLLVGIVASFHEPWYDEAQSYMIAKSASLYEMFFVLPHYEGHTPFWWLILTPFAKSPIPYEIAISSVNILLCTAAIYFIIFKSPFHRLVRLLLPFTFFYFYQYGVISRVYSLMMLAFSITAFTFRDRDEKPFRFVMALIFLCSTGAFGIVFAFGFSLVWVFEIWNRRNVWDFIKSILIDQRIHALIALFGFALWCVLMIMPNNDTYASNVDQNNNYIKSFFTLLIIMPINVSAADVIYGYGGLDLFSNLGILELATGFFISFVFMGAYIIFLRGYKMLKYFLVPYTTMCLFFSYTYFTTHHQGIVLLFIVFCAWIALSNKCVFELPYRIQKIAKSTNEIKFLNKIGITLLCFCIIVSVYWNVVAIKNEMEFNYGYGKEVSEFIKVNKLERLNIMGPWRHPKLKGSTNEVQFTNGVDVIDISPYFIQNIIMNLNNGDDNLAYMIHRLSNSQDDFKLWREKGIPDVFIGGAPSMLYVAGYTDIPEYVLVKKIHRTRIFKDKLYEGYYDIWIRSDMVESLKIK